jgi:hypothetical protein
VLALALVPWVGALEVLSVAVLQRLGRELSWLLHLWRREHLLVPWLLLGLWLVALAVAVAAAHLH